MADVPDRKKHRSHRAHHHTKSGRSGEGGESEGVTSEKVVKKTLRERHLKSRKWGGSWLCVL